jgi:hypothetical protein
VNSTEWLYPARFFGVRERCISGRGVPLGGSWHTDTAGLQVWFYVPLPSPQHGLCCGEPLCTLLHESRRRISRALGHIFRIGALRVVACSCPSLLAAGPMPFASSSG